MKSLKESWASSSSPSTNTTTKGGMKMTTTTRIVTQTSKANSRFIPEAERGWEIPEVPRSNSIMRRSSSGQTGSNGSWSNMYTFKTRWSSPKVEDEKTLAVITPKDGNKEREVRTSYFEREVDKLQEDESESSGSEIEEEDEDDTHEIGHMRERSSSVPDLTKLNKSKSIDREFEKEKQTQSPPSGQQLKESFGRRRGQAMKIDLESLQSAVTKKHLHPDEPPTPLLLTNQNSITPSLELQRTRSLHEISRGYPWKPDPDSHNKNHVPPSHRNPTSLQAFYDTHFGSSSGFRSVAGLADDVFHPIGSAKQMLSKLSVTKKNTKEQQSEEVVLEKQVKESPLSSYTPPSQTSSKENFLSWKSLPFSPAIFGMGSTSSQQTTKSTTHIGAYEPELIPTVHRDPHAHRYFKKVEGNVVILGGYRGSILRDASTHQMIWVPLKVGVNLRRPTLELGLTEKAEENSEELVIADEMLSGIGNMVDTGKRLITRLSHHNKKQKVKVHSWGYDWRLSLGKSSEKLEAFLQELYENSSEDQDKRQGAKVIAHSMGGLVAMHALARTKNPKIFNSLVFASTPFLGTANILGPFAFGDAALWNEEICSPRATFSFRSSFYLLPTNSKYHGKQLYQDQPQTDTEGGRCFEEEDGTPHDVDFLDPEIWNDLGLSPCIKRGARKAAAEYLERNLKREQNGNHLMHHDSSAISKHSSRDDPEKDKTDNVPSMPGVNVSMDSSAKGNKAVKGMNEAIKKGQEIAGGKDDTEETLQPENRQDSHKSNKKEGADSTNQNEMDQEEEEAISWAFLEKTLKETKQFFFELRTSFKQELFDQGVYPPVALLTSGRTPTVRGALVWPKGSESLEKQEAKAKGKNEEVNDILNSKDHPEDDHWKRSARLGDYSRMLYAPGDGVVLRESSIQLPGQWGKLLVKTEASVDEKGNHPLTNEEGVVETSHRHVTLLSDVDGIGRCLEACRRARINGWPQQD